MYGSKPITLRIGGWGNCSIAVANLSPRAPNKTCYMQLKICSYTSKYVILLKVLSKLKSSLKVSEIRMIPSIYWEFV